MTGRGVIKIVSLRTPPPLKISLKQILDQLEKQNYAITSDTNAARIFSRNTLKYRREGSLISSKGLVPSNNKNVYVFSLKPLIRIKRHGDFTFRLTTKKNKNLFP